MTMPFARRPHRRETALHCSCLILIQQDYSLVPKLQMLVSVLHLHSRGVLLSVHVIKHVRRYFQAVCPVLANN